MHPTQSIFRTCSALILGVAGLALGNSLAVAQVDPPQQSQPETNPIVVSIQASNPSTPAQLARAIQMTMDIGRDDLAIQYIGQLAQAVGSDEEWFKLLRDQGSEFTFRLAQHDGVQPAGRQLANTILDAANRFANDPARLEELTRKVVDPSIMLRSEALEDLLALGEVGAAALLNALSDDSRNADRSLLRGALQRFDNTSLQPILGGIRSTQPSLKLESARAARFLDSSEAALALFRPAWDEESPENLRQAARESLQSLMGFVPDPAQASQVLRASVDERLSNQVHPDQQFLSQQRIWRTHPRTQRLVEMKRSPFILRRIEAAERAEDLIKVQPDSGANQRTYALALLEAAKYLRQFEGNLGTSSEMAFAREAGPEFIEQVLADALRRDLIGAAAGACEILGAIGDAAVLRGNAIRPLAAAASHHDRRVQFAACEAIMAIDPTTAFPGSSAVAQTMMTLAHSRGSAKVLVGHPNATYAQNMAHTIGLLGFEAEAVSHGSEVLRTAGEDPDVEFLVLSESLGTPTYRDLIYQLRADPRTRRLPVALQLRTEGDDVAWQNEVARSLVQVYMVVDTREFENYDDWLRSTRDITRTRMPLLLIVKPGDTDIAFGWSSSDSQVRYIELPDSIALVDGGLPERLQTAFGLARPPVALAVKPRTLTTRNVEVTASLVLDPQEWVFWPEWTKQLHENEYTQAVDVVRATESGLVRVSAPAETLNLDSDRRLIRVEEIEFLYLRVSDLLFSTDSLTMTLPNVDAIQRGREMELLDPWVIAMPWTLDQTLIARQMDRLSLLADATPVNSSQRSRYAQTAVDWLARISEQPDRYPFWELTAYDQRIGTVVNAQSVTPAMCETLGNLGTPLAQRQLADIASENQLAPEIRQAAVAALDRAIQRRGIMLTSGQIQLQYDRYNASEELPEETQRILSGILDAIERPTSAKRQ